MVSIITTGIALYLIKKAVETGREEEASKIEYRSTNFYYALYLVACAVLLLKLF